MTFARKQLKLGSSLDVCASKLVNSAMRKGSGDNITVLVIDVGRLCASENVFDSD